MIFSFSDLVFNYITTLKFNMYMIIINFCFINIPILFKHCYRSK